MSGLFNLSGEVATVSSKKMLYVIIKRKGGLSGFLVITKISFFGLD